MTAALAGLHVLDLTSGPIGGLATMILADFGASVSQLPDPAYMELNEQPAARMWRRGKQVCQKPLHVAANEADIVIVTSPNGFSNADYASLHINHPGLIHVEISAARGLRTLPLDESVVGAVVGRMQSLNHLLPEPGPTYAAVQIASHATALNVVSGVLAAVYERNRSGHGQKIVTSLIDGFKPFDLGASMARQKHGPLIPGELPSDQLPLMPPLPLQPVQCSDGRWLQLGNLPMQRFAHFMRLIHLEDLIEHPNTEYVREQILITMQSRSCDAWLQEFIDDGEVVAHRWQSCSEALHDPDLVANGDIINLDGTTQLGPLCQLTATPATPGTTSAPRMVGFWQTPPASQIPPDSPPLTGVSVLELATQIAAPMATTFLADLGARVIRLDLPDDEPTTSAIEADVSWRCNQGKLRLGLDLDHLPGQTVLGQLLADADIFIHDFAPEQARKLGIGYAQLQKDFPHLIHITASGYGSRGPGAKRPLTYAAAGAATGGATYQVGGLSHEPLALPALRDAARQMMRANERTPEASSALQLCTSALMALVARESTGRGQAVHCNMLLASAYANFDDMLSYPGKPARPWLGPKLRGPRALHRLYECERGWVFLSIHRTVDWQTFCSLSHQLAWLDNHPSPLPSHASPEDDTLSGALANLFRQFPAEHWAQLFAAESIGCVVVRPSDLADFFVSESHPGSGWMALVSDDDQEKFYRHQPMLAFSRCRTRSQNATGPASATRQVMQRLGYSDDAINELLKASSIWTAKEEK